MKTISKICLSFILISTLLLSSCSKKQTDIFNMIPERAMAVISFHPGNLIEKGKLQEIDMIQKQVAENDLSKSILENPENSGIDINTYSNFFVLNDNGQYGCFLFPLKSKDDFDKMLTELADESDVDLEKSSLANYTVKADDEILFAYNNSVAMIIFTMDDYSNSELEEVAESIIHLDKEYALKTDKDFKAFLTEQKDINAWFSTNNVKDIPGIGNVGNTLDLFGGLKNNYGHVFVDFQDGYMSLITNLRFNQTLQETIDKYNFLDEKAIKDVLEYLPSENVLLVGNTNVNPEKIFDLLKFVNRDFDQTLKSMTSQIGLEKEDLKKIFSGEVAFSLNGINAGNTALKHIRLNKIPTMVFAARINNRNSFNKFLDLASEQAEIEEEDGVYTVINDGIPVYMVINKSDLVMSNNTDIIKEIADNGKIKENVIKSEHAEILSSNPICFYLNLDESTYTEDMKNFFEHKMKDKMIMGMETFGSSLKSMSVSANIENWEFRLELNNDSENSLYTLLNQAGNQNY